MTEQLKRLTWSDVREEAERVNPELAGIIDKINPSDEHWFIRQRYPFGSLVMNKAELQIYNNQGKLVSVKDDSIPTDIREGIGYNHYSNPVTLVTKGTFEIYISLVDRTIPMMSLIEPGSCFGAWRILNPYASQQPVFIWDMSAGARSIFMLPKISRAKKHDRLRRSYDLTSDTPINLLSHWHTFRELANHHDFPDIWEAEVVYFSEKWFGHLDDPVWSEFYTMFQTTSWGGTEYLRNQPIWNLIFSLILSEYQGKPNGYITDIVKYLIHMGIGAQPGFSPAVDNKAGPIQEIQKVYTDLYGLEDYAPIIMQPTTFCMGAEKSLPVYYSLQYPTSLEFRPSSRSRISLVTDLHEIRALLNRYKKSLLSGQYKVEDTPVVQLLETCQYDYFHNQVKLHAGMRNSAEIALDDSRFMRDLNGCTYEAFPDTCSFIKGCVRASKLSA